MLKKSGGSKLETQTHVPLQSSIHPTPLPFFCGWFRQSKNVFSFQKIKSLTGFETAVIALNTLFILSFHTGTFPLSFQDKGRHFWNTFKHVCKVHSPAGLQEVWQSAHCLQQVMPAPEQPPLQRAQRGAALPSRLWSRPLAGRHCSLSPPRCSSDVWVNFLLIHTEYNHYLLCLCSQLCGGK